MIFRRIHVNGFGVWNGLDLSNLGPGLNVFLAPNEGGKSTLMAFMRAVLFGFKRRGDTQRYEPLQGGRHGGFIELETDGATYRVAREQKGRSRGSVTVTDAEGAKHGEPKLESLLRHTTETLYENVFAFGLEELQRLESLQADDVAGHIYSAGMGAGSMTPVAFRQKLQDAMEELYRPRGKKQPITRLMGEIEAEQDRIEQLRQRPDEHADLLRRRRRVNERMQEHDATLRARQREYDSILRTQRGWPHYEQLLEAESTLETIGISAEQIQAATMSAAEAAAGADASSDRDDLAIAVASSQPSLDAAERIDPVELMSSAQRKLLDHGNKIRGLDAAAERMRELHATVLDRQKDARAQRHSLFDDLEKLGGDWSTERLRDTRTDVRGRDEIRGWAERFQQAEAEIQTAESRAADANLVYEAMRESREQIGRGTLLVTWGLILMAIVLTAVLVPAPARLVSTASIISVGLLLGALVTWLHTRGLKHRRSEQTVAALRESELWEQHEQAKEQLDRTGVEWRAWLKEQGLPTELSPRGALDLLDRLRSSQGKDQASRSAEKAVEAANAELQATCMGVIELLDGIDRQALDLRYDTIKMVDPLLATIAEVQAELDDVEAHRERIRRVLDTHSHARAGLRALAGPDGADVFREELSEWDPDRLATAVGDARGRLSSARADRDALQENLGALGQQIGHLEQDQELSNLLMNRESRRAELAERIHDWAAQAVTATLYDEAKRKYEAERQPEVLRLASRYFEMMTDGRYARVIAPLGENRLEVERADGGERLATTALSRGTGEQLYLAMRLALAKVYGDQAVPLPLVADDILVNFDDDRGRATAALLDVYAGEGYQVLAFTCHRHLVETFARNAPEARIQSLPAHG